MWPVTAAFGVVVSYNVVLLLIPPVSGWAAFVAARRLTGRFWPSLLAGAVYGFCPYELMHTWQGQPNLTVIALFPLMVYLVVRWWDGSLGRTGFVIWMALAMAAAVLHLQRGLRRDDRGGGGRPGDRLRGRRAARPGAKVARLAALTAIAYAGAVILAAPYLIYSLKHYQGALTRQQPAYSLPLVRLIVPMSQKMFGVTPLIRLLQPHRRRRDRELRRHPADRRPAALAVFAWRNRISRLLLVGFVFVIALAVGPNLVVTSIRHTYPLPWAGLWNLPIARSAEPSRFIVFGGPGPRARPGAVAGDPGRGQAAAGGALGPWAARGRGDHHRRAHVLPGGQSDPARLSAAGDHAPGQPAPGVHHPRHVPPVPAPGGDRRDPHPPGERRDAVPGRLRLLLPDRGRLHQRVTDARSTRYRTRSRCSPIRARQRCACSTTTPARPDWARSSSSRPGKNRG